LHQANLRFAERSEGSGLLQTGFCCGCAAADVDHDGFEDLYLTAVGGNQFWKNNGDGTFTETAKETGTQCGLWGSSAAFGDLDGDGNLDLYVANYLDVNQEEPVLCPEPRAPGGYIGCTPAMFRGVPDVVYLSDGSGGWREVSGAIQASFPGKALGVVICDLGGDSRPEVYVANDGQPNFLLVADSGGESGELRLRDRAVEASAAVNYEGFGQASMGIAAEDFNRDGRTDLFLTHFYRDTNTLYVNRSQGDLLLFDDGTRTSLLGQ
ncbi:MAG: FG-GAP repeat domain-containing protein, partial [Planctomycetaceae bacterium]